MPGLVIFRRRWSVGSDDLIVPGLVLLIIHSIWLIILTTCLIILEHTKSQCTIDLRDHTIGFVIILSGCVIVEFFIVWISMKGSILNTTPRRSISKLLYIRLVILIIEIIWLVISIFWLRKYSMSCPVGFGSKAILGATCFNWFTVICVFVLFWCTFDSAGRSWVKMKNYQENLKNTSYNYRRSGSQRNWRHRKMLRQYQDSWDRRCRFLFCCLKHRDRNENSFADIARLLADYFRDLDVVPSDVIAALIILRRNQKSQRKLIVKERINSTFQFLSGSAITTQTKFLDVSHKAVANEIQTLIHYLHYAIAIYGWPLFIMMNTSKGIFQLCSNLKCTLQTPCFCCCFPIKQAKKVSDDNCCQCNYAAFKNICQSHNYDIVYATYHVSVAEPPFFVVVDYEKRSVVISVRGTLSLQDIITDLNAEGEILPTNPVREDWIGHKGMIDAASYIKNKIIEKEILKLAFNYCPEKGTQNYNLVLVGHSLGAGTASILAIMLKEQYPDLVCFAYAPPGGLLSIPVLEYTKDFIISIVLGKDVVPRLGLHQMETLRFQLIKSLKANEDSKWNIISNGICCYCKNEDDEDAIDEQTIIEVDAEDKKIASHPMDDSIALTVHKSLYPPGRIIHIVRNHLNKEDKKYEKKWRRVVQKDQPIYQAIWAENKNFEKIIISPVMLQDHMPDKILHALESLLTNTGPTKPQRKIVNINSDSQLNRLDNIYAITNSPNDTSALRDQNRLIYETSFTNSPMNCVKNKNFSNQYYPPHVKKIDLLNNWVGTAPLASPEAFSEISYVSSSNESNAIHTFLRNFNYNITRKYSSKSNLNNSNQNHHLNHSNQNHHLNIPLINSDYQSNASPDCDQNVEKEERIDVDKKIDIIENCNDGFTFSHSPDDNLRENNCHKNDNFNQSKASQYSASDGDLTKVCQMSTSLRRSHEKMRINNLDDSTVVFDNSSSQSDKKQNLGILFNKLITIESPQIDQLNQSNNT